MTKAKLATISSRDLLTQMDVVILVGGTHNLAASLAVEWAGHGIRVNCISPGYMLTAL
jgi:NAD(P)-dependent dehydrogenase (short-subunit alcohol dehydrogenase family)